MGCEEQKSLPLNYLPVKFLFVGTLVAIARAMPKLFSKKVHYLLDFLSRLWSNVHVVGRET